MTAPNTGNRLVGETIVSRISKTSRALLSGGALVAGLMFTGSCEVKTPAPAETAAGTPAAEPQAAVFTPRLTTPRLAPVDPADPALSDAQRAMLASRADFNIYKTLAHHPDLYAKWSPLGQFLLNGSSLEPRHRELAMLRMGWLCQSEYEFAQHARIATTSAGMTAEEVQRIAGDPNAAGWGEADRAVLQMVDDLRYDAMVSDGTWAALSLNFSQEQVIELLYTASQYQLVSMALNSLGVQLDPVLEFRLPTGVPLPATAGPVKGERLTAPRIAPVPLAEFTPEQRELAKGQINADGSIMNLYGTLITHPGLYGPRLTFGRYIQREGLLDPKTREMLILRTAVLLDAPYEWAHHADPAKAAGLTDAQLSDIVAGPTAAGWSPAERAVLQAADDLRREAFITQPVWDELSKSYDTKQMVEIIYTVGAYTMTAAALNSFGVQVEPGYPATPG